MFLGGIIGLSIAAIVVITTNCGQTAAALWGAGATNLGLLLGGCLGLYLDK